MSEDEATTDAEPEAETRPEDSPAVAAKRPSSRRKKQNEAPAETESPEETAAPPEEQASGDGDAVARAEAMMDQMGERVGHLVADAGQRLRRLGALAREEAEDVVAEARNISKRNQGTGSGS